MEVYHHGSFLYNFVKEVDVPHSFIVELYVVMDVLVDDDDCFVLNTHVEEVIVFDFFFVDVSFGDYVLLVDGVV